MSFWTRMFSAVVCWGLSALILLTVASHYIPSTAQLDLIPKLLWVLGVAVAVICVLVGVLALWMRVWLGRYW